MTDLRMEDLKPTEVPFDDGIPKWKNTADSEEPTKKTLGGMFGIPQRDKPLRTPKETVKPPKLTSSMKDTLEQLYAGIGGMILPFDEVCGQVIIDSAPMCAATVYYAAQQNDALRRFVISLTQTSVTGALIIAHLPIIMAIAAHHSPNAQIKMGAMGGLMATKMMSAENLEKLREQAERDGDDPV